MSAEKREFDLALGQVAAALHTPSPADQFVEICGDEQIYRALILASEDFIKRNPEIEQGRMPSEYVMGLWIGLIAGFRAGQELQKAQLESSS